MKRWTRNQAVLGTAPRWLGRVGDIILSVYGFGAYSASSVNHLFHFQKQKNLVERFLPAVKTSP